MANKLKLKKGVELSSQTALYEGCQISETSITANVGTDKIEDVFHHFIAMHDEPLFFILELPAKSDEETEISNGVVKTFHKNVYYIDGCSMEEAAAILFRTGKILFDDGLVSFGFGCHHSHDEMMFGKYNVLTVYSENIKNYADFFAAHNIEKTPQLVTAWDIITTETPGACHLYEIDKKTIYDIPDMFKDWGIYLAEQREG